ECSVQFGGASSESSCGSKSRTRRKTPQNSRAACRSSRPLAPHDLGASPQAKAPRSRGIGPQPAGSRLDELFLGRCPNELRLVPCFLLGRSGLVETERWARAHGRRIGGRGGANPPRGGRPRRGVGEGGGGVPPWFVWGACAHSLALARL